MSTNAPKAKRQRTPSQLGRAKRSKGSASERAASKLLHGVWPEAKRGIGQMRASGEVPDIDGTPIWWEVKNHLRAPNVWAAFQQGIEASAGKKPVMVLARKTGEPWLVSMTVEHFLAIMHLLNGACLSRDRELLAALESAKLAGSVDGGQAGSKP